VNYSYQIPTPSFGGRAVQAILGNWEASGVTQFTTGAALDPSCTWDRNDIQFSDPSLSGVAERCELTGAPIDSGFAVDGSLPEDAQQHFNQAAFAAPVADIANGIGNLGNAPSGVLRHPSWVNWDFTFARRIPVNVGRGGSFRIQVQFYNLFNQVEFTTLNAAMDFTADGTNQEVDTGKYTATTSPFNMGVTLRFDY